MKTTTKPTLVLTATLLTAFAAVAAPPMQPPGKPLTAGDIDKAFATADTDKDGVVSKAEFAAFLTAAGKARSVNAKGGPPEIKGQSEQGKAKAEQAKQQGKAKAEQAKQQGKLKSEQAKQQGKVEGQEAVEETEIEIEVEGAEG